MRSTSTAPVGGRSPHRVKHTLRVLAVDQLTAESVTVAFEPTDTHSELFDYRPGQHITLTIPLPSGDVERCYSLCSSPGLPEPLTIGVKRVAGGDASNWICDHLRPGMTIESTYPGGLFVPHSLDTDFLLLAAGSGITPLLSIAKSALAQNNHSHVVVLYANQHRDSVMFATQLDHLQATHTGRLNVLDWFDAERGHPTPDGVSALIADHVDREIFVCGPTPFLGVVQETMALLDVEWGRVKRERFSFDTNRGSPEQPIADRDKNHATAHLDIRGDTITIDWPRDTVLLDQLIDRGIDIPYVCRQGYCGGCVCTITAGAVRMLANDALDDADIAEGRRLACQSVPLTDEIAAKFLD